jgi:hypothetical protein
MPSYERLMDDPTGEFPDDPEAGIFDPEDEDEDD